MQVVINGDIEEIAKATIQELLSWRELDCAKVVVEINGEIVPPDKFPTTVLNAGDAVEIIQFVGGG